MYACECDVQQATALLEMARGPSAPAVAQVVRPFASEADAVRWQSEVVPRLRAQLLVRVPDAGRRASGAVALDEWTVFRIDDEALAALAFRTAEPR